jgi:hypothetical protein
VYSNYGKGKYGYGMGIFHDKRDDRYYVDRHLSRGHGDGDLKTLRVSYGGYDTLDQAKAKVAECIVEIQQHGLDHIPAPVAKQPKRTTAKLDEMTSKLREMRLEGKTIRQITDATGLDYGAIYNRIRDLGIDNRKGAAHGGIKLTEDNVREIRRFAASGVTQTQIAYQFGVSTAMINGILKGRAWAHVK